MQISYHDKNYRIGLNWEGVIRQSAREAAERLRKQIDQQILDSFLETADGRT